MKDQGKDHGIFSLCGLIGTYLSTLLFDVFVVVLLVQKSMLLVIGWLLVCRSCTSPFNLHVRYLGLSVVSMVVLVKSSHYITSLHHLTYLLIVVLCCG